MFGVRPLPSIPKTWAGVSNPGERRAALSLSVEDPRLRRGNMGVLGRNNSVTVMNLSYCRLYRTFKFNWFHTLECITLWSVNISDGMLVNLVDNCLLLESLYLRECTLLTHIVIIYPPKMKSLTIVNCWNLREMEIASQVLTTFHLFNTFPRVFVYGTMTQMVDFAVILFKDEGCNEHDNWEDMQIDLSPVQVSLGIQDYIISKAVCVCGVTNVLADDLPNQTLRNTISRILESMTSCTENAGSLVHVTDMESTCSIQPKFTSPTLSAASKDECKLHLLNGYTLGAKECEVASEGKAENVAAHSSERKAAKVTDPSEATQDSASAKEPISLENAPVPEETQEKFLGGEQGKKKKKKKTRLPVSAAADMQWRAFQDFGAENFSGMPLGSSAFNPYWAGGMPLGMDGYMVPFPGAMLYMGYLPGLFDVPFGGVLPQDPFAGQGYMMSAVPQRHSRLYYIKGNVCMWSDKCTS